MRTPERVEMSAAVWPLGGSVDPAVTEMEFAFEGAVIEWRGPAPFHFVEIPAETSEDIKFAAKGVEYWGQVPVTARIDGVEFTTGLFPKDGRYLLPVKDAVRKPLGIELGEVVAVGMEIIRRRR